MARSVVIRGAREIRAFASAIAKVDARSRSRLPEPGTTTELIRAIGAVGLVRAREILAEVEASVTRTPPASTRGVEPQGPAKNANEFREREREVILKALEATRWNRARAAELVGMSRRTFYRRLLQLGLT